MLRVLFWLAVAVLPCALLYGCKGDKEEAAEEPKPAEAHKAIKVNDIRLDNAHRISAKVYSGAQPEGEAAFKALQELGIKTVISVDGATPNLEAAHKYGLKYVHLPIGYDGIPPERAMEIAKAIKDLPGPIYVHCHHGKHRGPAAAAVGCVLAGQITTDEALADMKVFGTGENYQGLWAAAREAKPIDPKELKKLKVDFKEVAPIPPLADAMVHLDDLSENLKLCKAAGWKTPKNHPDLDPAHEALKLREVHTEIMRTDDFVKRLDDFKTWMKEGEKRSQQLEDALRAFSKDPAAKPAPVDEAYAGLQTNCTACHKVYRNVPHGSKKP